MSDEPKKGETRPYELSEFAKKWNIPSIKARIILEQKGPSRPNCDAEAERFKKAMNRNRGKGY
jgi:hypothetical protein